MLCLSSFSLNDMLQMSASLRKLGADATSLAAVAQRTVRHLYDTLRDKDGQPACLLVRGFKLHPYGALPHELSALAQTQSPEPLTAELKCLVLLATAGPLPQWCDPRQSSGHRAIPLLGPPMVQKAPMISRLIQQLGLDLAAALAPSADLIMEMAQTTYNVFYVPEALGSPYIPAQESFVRRYGVRSVLGFGGVLPDGNLFAYIMFCRVFLDRDIAEMWKTIATSIKIAMIPHYQAAFARPGSPP